MFILHAGRTKNISYPVTPSTEIAAGSLVVFSSGYLVAATSSTHAYETAGVLVKAIASTDDDYADARTVEVQVPIENYTEWEAPVTSGLVAADVGLFQDLTDAVTVNRGSSTYDIAQCIKVLSTTKGIFHLNIGNAGQASVTA